MTLLPFQKPGGPDLYTNQRDAFRGARLRSLEDYSNCPRWRWDEVYDITGKMLPGDLTILGALTGNGKTAYLLSQLDYLSGLEHPVLYAPLELDPAQMYRQWAAWRLGYPWETVARNAWGELEAGAQDKLLACLSTLYLKWVYFAPERRITLASLKGWLGEVCGLHRGPRASEPLPVVIIDHFHRMSLASGSDGYRLAATDAARALKDMAREYGVHVVAAAQLNRVASNAVLDRYMPPRLERLKETAGLAEEADVVLMLSRAMKRDIDTVTLKDIQSGHRSEREIEEPGIMQVTNRKHRLADSARDRTVRLKVDRGRVLSPWETP